MSDDGKGPVRFGPDGLGRFQRLPGGFVAGFTTRQLAGDGMPAQLGARRLAEALGAPQAETTRARQVHGRAVLSVERPPAPGADVAIGEGDALLTRWPDRLLIVQTADCLPLLLMDPVHGWIAAVHAGWRGTAARIVDAVLDRLETAGVPLDSLVAVMGPSISRDRYEVGPEVIAALRKAYPEVPEELGQSPGAGDRVWLDVAAYNREALLRRGVKPENLLDSRLCTATDAALFASYRRDGAKTGRIFTGVLRRS